MHSRVRACIRSHKLHKFSLIDFVFVIAFISELPVLEALNGRSHRFASSPLLSSGLFVFCPGPCLPGHAQGAT